MLPCLALAVAVLIVCQFWELPESTEDVFSLFSPADIRRTRDNNLANLETLVLAVTSRLIVLRSHPSFPDPDLAPERDALNCIRVLTRLLPFLYEADHLEQWEDQFFWAARRKRSRRGQLRSEVIFDEADPEQTPTAQEPESETAKPLAEEIIDTLIDLLFFSDFTLPKVSSGKNKVTYAIWQSGVGCNTPVASTKEFESNRTEILRLLLTFASKSMYEFAAILPVKGVKAVTYMATCPDKQVVLSVLCSLLNTVGPTTAYTDVANASRPSSTTLQHGACHTTTSSSETRGRYWSRIACNCFSSLSYTPYQSLGMDQRRRTSFAIFLAVYTGHKTFSSWSMA